MKKTLLTVIFSIITIIAVFADEPTITISGRVKDATFKADLINAKVLLYDSDGNVCDSVRANQGRTYRAGAVDTLSEFYFSVPRVDSTYIIDVMCEGYNTLTLTYHLEKPGKRERYRRMPVTYLSRAPKMLKEVVVKTSKIKFYNKGDTVVYSADAFQLAEGSMLDALVAQLPGVELNNNGQIKVNGEFVESLLLNGKEFMDGNNNLMLENIAAYTVKNIQVYEGQKKEDRQKGDLTAPKVLTMDVKLKKEYNIGWIINAQGGYGTEDRYLGRVFAQWFNPTTRLSFVGNINNLNDNRQPGKNDTWTPEQMPTGTKEYAMAGFDYNYENPEETQSASGNILFAQTRNKVQTTTARTNFLPGGDTYDNTFSSGNMRETALKTNHYFFKEMGSFSTNIGIGGEYNYTKNTSSELAGTFSTEQTGITAEILDAIYSDGTPDKLEDIINRSKTRFDGWHKQLYGAITPYFSYKIPSSNDRLSLGLDASYSSDKEHLWNDYNINYGADPTPAVKRRQYIDNTPNHTLNLSSSLVYGTTIKNCWVSFRYRFNFNDKVKDSYMYALERLEDMGVYGVLPANYLDALDPANSYSSRLITGEHTLSPSLRYDKNITDNARLMVFISPRVGIIHRHLDYWRNDRSYLESKTNATFTLSSIWDGMIEMQFGKKKRGYRNSVRYSYRIDQTLPELEDMLDITDDSNPLNIYYGNPGLKTATRHRHLFRWSYSPSSYQFHNIFYASFANTNNAITRGYTYDTHTGVRYNRKYNVDGNRIIAFTNEINWQFGATKQFTLSSETDLNLTRYADMIGVDMEAPQQFMINNNSISERLRIGWNFASGQNIMIRGDYTNRHTISSQPGFSTINAWHLNYGISGVFTLPAGFGISTDFMCYTRHGYGSSYLDTTDPVWNLRLTYAPPRLKHFVFTVDGFDLLQKLSNVNYAVNAAGRTVSYTNTIPRYILFSIQYRLNIQPKKR